MTAGARGGFANGGAVVVDHGHVVDLLATDDVTRALDLARLGARSGPLRELNVEDEMQVLVAYESTHGSTAEVARWVSGELRMAGLDAEVRAAAQYTIPARGVR